MAVLGNIWKRFADLLPKTSRVVGTVISVTGGGSYTVQLSGGGTLQALSDVNYSVNARVFVAGRKIDGTAPVLTSLTIDV